MSVDPRHVMHLESGRLASTPRDLIRDTFRRLPAHPQGQRLVVHLHGGLVPMADGLAVAERLLPVYQRAGSFPFFVVWESGIREALVNNLHEIAGEGFFRALLRLVLKFSMAKIDQGRVRSAPPALTIDDGAFEVAFGALAAGEEPCASLGGSGCPSVTGLSAREERHFREALERDPDIAREAACISGALATLPATGSGHARHVPVLRISPAVLTDIRREIDTRPFGPPGLPARLVSGATSALYRTVKRLATGRDHGLYATAFEEVLREFYLGDLITGLWQLMKQDTADAFEPDGSRFGGSALLDELAAGCGAGYRPDVCLVGHSAGTVFACRWLQHAAPRGATGMSFDLALLAPAVTFDLLAAVMRDHATSVGRVRLFGLSDARERGDALIPGVYPRSLLYFVSGVLEGHADRPLVGMQRYHSARPPYDPSEHPAIRRVLDLLAKEPGSAVWSPQGGMPGHASDAASHGSLDDDPATLESVVHFIEHAHSPSSLDGLPAA